MKTSNLLKAKAQLILDQPFFASILFTMPMVEDSSIPTLATDGDSIKYNAKFIESLSLQETVFVLAHETLHCVLQHMHRRGNRNPNRWNMAADYVINKTLIEERIGNMPKGCLYGPSFPSTATAEEIYKLLPKESEEQPSGAGHGNGGALDTVSDAGKDQAEQAQKQAEMKVKVIQATNAAKMMGKLSAGMERIAHEMTRSKTDWAAVLRNFMTERTKTDWSYAKPKRRFLADDIYLPGFTGEKLESLVVAVDCSGSIDQDLLNRFGAEIKGIIQDVNPSTVHVIYFDSEVLRHETYTGTDSIELKPIGGGGTDFRPIFKFIDTNNLNPTACVILTDLEGRFGDQAPSFPLLWANTNNSDQTAPFGETLRIE